MRPVIARLVAALVGAVALAGAVGGTAQAENLMNFTIPEANLSIALPESWAVITRAGVQAHPESVDATKVAGLQSFLEQTDGYVTAVDQSITTEIVVIVSDPPPGEQRVWNMNEVSEDQLVTLGDTIAQQAVINHYDVSLEGRFRNSAATYAVLSGTSSSGDDFYEQYYTIVNGRQTSITLHSYSAALTADQSALLQQIVSSVKYLDIRADPEPSLDPARAGTTPSQGSGMTPGVITGLIIVGAAVLAGAAYGAFRLVKRDSAAEQPAIGSSNRHPGRPDAAPSRRPPAAATGPVRRR